jgi:hypothetical protein
MWWSSHDKTVPPLLGCTTRPYRSHSLANPAADTRALREGARRSAEAVADQAEELHRLAGEWGWAVDQPADEPVDGGHKGDGDGGAAAYPPAGPQPQQPQAVSYPPAGDAATHSGTTTTTAALPREVFQRAQGYYWRYHPDDDAPDDGDADGSGGAPARRRRIKHDSFYYLVESMRERAAARGGAAPSKN